MSKTDLIAVAIPYHHGREYLKQAIESVLRQTLLPARLVIVDNSPTGEALALVKEYSYPIEYITSAPGLGLAAYFNQCLDSAKAPWCTVMHSDDVMMPGYIAGMSAAIAQNPTAALLFCKARIIGPQGGEVFSFKDWVKGFLWPRMQPQVVLAGEEGLTALMRGNFIMCPSVCYNMNVLQTTRFDAQWRFLLDFDLYGRLLLAGKTLVGLHHPLYAYRRHPGTMTALSEKDFSMFIENARCINALAVQAQDKGWLTAAATGKRKIILHLQVALYALCALRPGNIGQVWQSVQRYRAAI